MNYRRFGLLAGGFALFFTLSITYMLMDGVWKWEIVVLSIIGGCIWALNFGWVRSTTPVEYSYMEVVFGWQGFDGNNKFYPAVMEKALGHNHFNGDIKSSSSDRVIATVECWLPLDVGEVVLWMELPHGWMFAEVVGGKLTGRAWVCGVRPPDNLVEVDKT